MQITTKTRGILITDVQGWGIDFFFFLKLCVEQNFKAKWNMWRMSCLANLPSAKLENSFLNVARARRAQIWRIGNWWPGLWRKNQTAGRPRQCLLPSSKQQQAAKPAKS